MSKVFYIFGDEKYLVNQEINKIKKEYTENYLDLNVIEVSPSNFYNEMMTYPIMMMEKKLLILKEISEENIKYFNELPEYVDILVLGQLDKRTKAYKTIKKIGEIIEVKKYSKPQMINWAKELLLSFGTKVNKNIVEYIITERTGLDNMNLIEMELKKLSYINEPITKDVVDKVIPQSIESTAFELTDSILANNKEKSFILIKELVDRGEWMPAILTLVNKNFALLKLLKTIPKDIVISTTKTHYFIVNKLVEYKDEYSDEKLEELINLCQDLDFQMKNSIPQRIAMEKLIAFI